MRVEIIRSPMDVSLPPAAALEFDFAHANRHRSGEQVHDWDSFEVFAHGEGRLNQPR